MPLNKLSCTNANHWCILFFSPMYQLKGIKYDASHMEKNHGSVYCSLGCSFLLRCPTDGPVWRVFVSSYGTCNRRISEQTSLQSATWVTSKTQAHDEMPHVLKQLLFSSCWTGHRYYVRTRVLDKTIFIIILINKCLTLHLK